MDLPSFLWLWRIAAWSMGLAIFAYLILSISGTTIFIRRQGTISAPNWLRLFHYSFGGILIILVILLLGIGLVGTLGHYGSLGHSWHLPAGLVTVVLVLISAWSATQISQEKSWARVVHVTLNLILLVSFIAVSLTGWGVVQKYL